MSIITLVSYLVAREGHVFVFSGGGPECESCRFRKVCIDRLRKGHVYRIVKVLNIRNRCPINKYVITVEVEEEPIEVLIPANLAVEGMTITFERRNCDINKCPYYTLCNPRLLPRDRCKVKILKILEKVNCGKGYSLRKAKVVLSD